MIEDAPHNDGEAMGICQRLRAKRAVTRVIGQIGSGCSYNALEHPTALEMEAAAIIEQLTSSLEACRAYFEVQEETGSRRPAMLKIIDAGLTLAHTRSVAVGDMK